MNHRISQKDRVGLIHPSVDAHTLGVSSFSSLLEECGIGVEIADAEPCAAALDLKNPGNRVLLREWIRATRCTVLGFSYRLDPGDALALFGAFYEFLQVQKLLKTGGGTVVGLYFAGLPESCERVRRAFPQIDAVFHGDETPMETLSALGLPEGLIPAALLQGAEYDEARLQFGRELINKELFRAFKPVDRSGYPEFGTRKDSVLARLAHGEAHTLPPLIRAHVGPYFPDRDLALRTFLDWSRELARTGFLDVVSIGTSQLSQADFEGDWSGKTDGGGVPLHSEDEFRAVWEAGRPMLFRSYAGTKGIPRMAQMLERSINTAWHALSLWWFCQLDGRGPNPLLANLLEHEATLKVIAQSGKPFEANVPHHFSFRGADDVTYVVSAYLAARLAKENGISTYIMQIMLNTPKSTWGVQDLAKARAALTLVRELEEPAFRVLLQPRGGLDYFSPKQHKAMVQLAAVTALMDDIEPEDERSPGLIHVVSHSEGTHLADPAVVNESVQITQQALIEYRALRRRGEIRQMGTDPEVLLRTQTLLAEARTLLAGIVEEVPHFFTAVGLHAVFSAGFLPVPYLWQCRDQYPAAVQWKTRLIRGAVCTVDSAGAPLSAAQRIAIIRNQLNSLK